MTLTFPLSPLALWSDGPCWRSCYPTMEECCRSRTLPFAMAATLMAVNGKRCYGIFRGAALNTKQSKPPPAPRSTTRSPGLKAPIENGFPNTGKSFNRASGGNEGCRESLRAIECATAPSAKVSTHDEGYVAETAVLPQERTAEPCRDRPRPLPMCRYGERDELLFSEIPVPCSAEEITNQRRAPNIFTGGGTRPARSSRYRPR